MNFINISSHSSDKWEEEQKKAAVHPLSGKRLEIIDIAFPEIKPDSTLLDLEDIVNNTIRDIFWISSSIIDESDYSDVVYIMGELGFTYKFLLKCAKFYPQFFLVHSTRIIREENGQKISKFYKFRPYCWKILRKYYW
jgi:hypothetical protein